MADLLNQDKLKQPAPLTLQPKPATTTTTTQTPTMPFREDLNKQADRDSAESINRFKVIGDALKESTKQAFQQPAPTPELKGFTDTLAAQDPTAKIQQQTAERLTAPSTGLSEVERTKALSDTSRLLQQIQESERAGAVRTFGAGTGQVQSALGESARSQEQIIGDLQANLAAQSEGIRRAQESDKLAGGLQFLAQKSQEKLAKMNMNLTEKLATEANDLTRSENALNRTFQSLESDKQIAATAAIANNDIIYKTQALEKGFLNEKEMLDLRGNLEKDLLALGFDNEMASKLADQKHDLIVRENEHEFLTKMDTMDKTWRTGERVSAQEFETIITKLKQDFEENQNELNRILQLDLQGNDLAYRENARIAGEAFAKLMQTGQFTHEEAMLESSQVFEKGMQEDGFSQEQILQSVGIMADMQTQQRDIDSREAMLAVQMAQDNKQFYDQLNLDQKAIDANIEQNRAEMELAMKNFGLTEKQVNAALESDATGDALGALSMAMEMLPDNEAALQPFTERLFQAIGDAAGIPQDQISAAIEANATTAGPQRQTPSSVTSLANDVIAGTEGSKEELVSTLQNLSSLEWSAITADEKTMEAIEKSGAIPTISSKADRFLTITQFNDSGLTADDIIFTNDGKQTNVAGEGSGTGSIVFFNGVPYRLTTYESRYDSTGRNEQKGRLYGVSMEDPEAGEVKLTDTGWKFVRGAR